MSDTILIPVTLTVSQKQVDELMKRLPGDAGPGPAIAAYANSLVCALADGGMILRPDEVDRIEQSIGQEIGGVDDIVPLLEAGAGRSGGKLRGFWEIDPTYEPAIASKAEFQEIPVNELVQRVIDECVDQGWLLGDIIPQPQRVLMTPEDHQRLVDELGGQFYNGTELAAMIHAKLGMTEASAEESSTEAAALFE